MFDMISFSYDIIRVFPHFNIHFVADTPKSWNSLRNDLIAAIHRSVSSSGKKNISLELLQLVLIPETTIIKSLSLTIMPDMWAIAVHVILLVSCSALLTRGIPGGQPDFISLLDTGSAVPKSICYSSHQNAQFTQCEVY